MMRRVAVVMCVVAVSGACSKSGSDDTPARTLTTTASAARVKVIGAQHVGGTRRAIEDLDRYCGGRSRIQLRTAALASRCNAALTTLSTRARAFARALVFVRAPSDLEPLIADTIDAAKPILDIVRTYPRAQCVTPAPRRDSRCEDAARDLGTVVNELDAVLDQWKTQLGVS
jgi:hypothetical protein